MSVKPIQIEQAKKDAATVVPLRSKTQAETKRKTYHQKLQKIHLPRKDNTLFCRYELKYRIRETKARAIAQYIQSYVAPDSYSRNCPDYEYLISSTYLDSSGLDLCRETIEKKKNRFKLRIRCYDDKPETPCFFEVKRRLNNVILKGRARMSKDQVETIMKGRTPPGVLYKKDEQVLSQFQFYVQMLQARPVVLIRYMRQAFEDDSPNRVRITFDRQLSYKSVNRSVVTTNGPGWHLVPMDFVILEIKFTNHYPVWLNDLTKIFDLKQTAMSKYVSSIKQSRVMGYNNWQSNLEISQYG